MNKYFWKHFLIIIFIISLNSCSSSDDKINKDKFTNKIKRLSPGTVQICGTIQNIQNQSEPLVAKIRIDTVFSYGQSTPPLVTNNNLEINIPKSLIDKSKENNYLEPNKVVYLELSYQKLLSMSNQEKSKWTVIKIASNKTFK